MERNRRKRGARNEAGFSMIELMVVVVIIGMLAALVAVNVLGNLETASQEAARAQISTFKTALTTYRLEYKKFPTKGEGLEALINNPKNKRYLDATNIPKDPWNNDYVYNVPGPDGRPFEIISYGADGQKGGEGENADIVSWNLQGDSD